MKLTIEKNTLASGLAKVSGIVERKNTIPILANIKLEAELGSLTITGTDLEIEVQTKVEADVVTYGGVTVAADLLSNVVKRLDASKPVTIELDANERLRVASGRSKFDFSTLPVCDYPPIAKDRTDDGFTMTAPDLARLLNKTTFAMSSEEARYYLNGIYFHSTEDGITTVATNGSVLAKSWVDYDYTFSGVIIPRKTVNELRKILDLGDVNVHVSPHQIRFDMGETVIVSKVIDGSFPDYQRVIPQDPPDKFRVDAKAFANAAAIVALVSEGKIRCVKMSVSNGAVNLSSSGTHNAQDEIEAYVSGGEVIMGFNSKYLADVLAQAEGGDVEVAYRSKDAGSPAVVTTTEDPKFLAVVMPMRL